MLPYSAILLSALALASAGALHAQEVKPRSTTDRLPKPAGVTAAQQPDGRIRVVWRAVDGAARYKVIRSVPPTASQAVTLPNPADTQYVDTDVKAGSTYYYVVSAVNEAGIEGLRTGSAPVTAAAVVAPVDTTPPLASVPPPTNVTVKMYDYLRPQVNWETSVPGARVIIERREVLSTSAGGEGTWKEAVPLGDKSWNCSKCTFTEDRPLQVNAQSQYRVTVVEAAPSTRRSEPVTSNTVSLVVYGMAPPEMHLMRLVKGESSQMPFRPNGTDLQYMSMDTSIVSIWSPGVVKAKESGSTFVTAVGRNQDGAIQLWVWQTEVGP